MKRNMDLVREMLLIIEAAPAGHEIRPGDFSALEDIGALGLLEHVILMGQARFIQADIHLPKAGSPDGYYYIKRITWEGHDYLDSVRDAGVWQTTKTMILSKGGALTFELIKAVATQVVKQRIGLLPG
jgi:hypothetical protein